jgi:putative acetyltransferase
MIVRAEKSRRQNATRLMNLRLASPMKRIWSTHFECHPFISLVALVDEQVVGHISFSPVTVEWKTEPRSVSPRHGGLARIPGRIGSRLVREGLKECQGIGHDIVVVLGHPEYYPRFGFAPASLKGLRSEYDVRDEVFMVLELSEGALAGRRGLVKFIPSSTMCD